MEQVYVYEEEEEQGLTFKKIGRFFKKGWLPMVLGVVIAAILATVIALPVKFFYKSEEVGQTSIEYLYDGVTEGLSPNGGTLNPDNIISPAVLSKAVESANLGNTIKDISELRSACRVEGVYPEEYYKLVQSAADGNSQAIAELRNYKLIPSRYDIIISEPAKLGLSDAQTTQLLDKIVLAYYEDFQTRYSVSNMFATGIYDLASDDTLEFYDVYDTYVESLIPVKEYIDELQSLAPTFTSTAYSTDFATLSSELNRLSSSYDNYNTYLLANNVWREKSVASVTLEKQKKAIDEKKKNLKTLIDALDAQIKAIPPLTITVVSGNDGSNISSSSAAYYALLDKFNTELASYNKQMRIYDDQLSNIDLRLENLDPSTPTPDADIQYATARIAALEAETQALVEKVNGAVSDYYDTTFVASSVRRVKPSTVTRKSADFNLLIVYLCAVLGGLLVGAIVAGVRISKANAKAKLAQNAATASAPTEAEKAEAEGGKETKK